MLGVLLSGKSSKKRRKRFKGTIRRKQIKDAVDSYNENIPEVHRTVVSNHAKNYLKINKAAVKKYAKNHPKMNKQAVNNYKKKEQTKVWKNKFMSGCRYDNKVDYYIDKSVDLGPRAPYTWCLAYKWQQENPMRRVAVAKKFSSLPLSGSIQC